MDNSFSETDTSVNPIDLISFSKKHRVPLILQSEMTECGLACVGMIASYYGHKVNLPALRKQCLIGSQGMSLKDVVDLASHFQLTSRALKCELSELKALSLPAILHWNLDHFVVLTSITAKHVQINDPAKGKIELTLEQVSEHYTGVALELTPLSTFKKQDSRVLMKVSDLWSNIVGLKRSLLTIFFISLALQFLLLTTPYYTQWIVDKVLLTNDRALLIVLAIAFSFITLFQVAIKALRSWVVLRFSSHLSMQMGANLFSHLVKLPIEFFLKRHIGDVVSRFGSLSEIREMLTNSVIEALIDGIMASVIIVLMALYSPILTLIVTGFLFLSFLVQWAFYYPNRKVYEELINDRAREESVFLETLRAMQTIKLYNQESRRSGLWLNRSADVINSTISLSKLNISEEAIVKLISGLEMIVIMYMGAIAVIEQSMTIGMLLAIIAYKQMFLESAYNLIDKLFEFKLLGLHLERLSDITLHAAEESRPEAISVHDTLKGDIKVTNLSYRYSANTEWVLKDVSFDIPAGQSVAIVGPSGCGKSTLIKAILRMIEPEVGTIQFSGVDIQDLNLREYRSKIGTVMQDDTLLSGTLVDNITMFESDYNPEKLSYSCRLAELDTVTDKLPMGMNTLVGDMGNTLSGGQIQRVLLARALYSQPDVLILDESTSNLDSESLHSVNDNIAKLNMTRILIAHRKETIESADRVISI